MCCESLAQPRSRRMANIYIVDDPEYDRLKDYPRCAINSVYATSGRNLYTLCNVLELCSKPQTQIHAIAFIHFSNHENEDQKNINSTDAFDKAAVDWMPSVPLLAYVSRKICQAGGRIVIFSGGGAVPWSNPLMKKVEEELRVHGFQTGWHCTSISLGEIPKAHEAYGFSVLPREWRVDALLYPPSYNLVAMLILCQGMLILKADLSGGAPMNDQSDPNQGYVDRAMKRMFPPSGKATIKAELGDAQKEEYFKQMQAVRWWRNVFQKKVALVDELKREWGKSVDKEWGCVGGVGAWIRPPADLESVSLSLSDIIPNGDISIGQVALAYCAIAHRLEKR